MLFLVMHRGENTAIRFVARRDEHFTTLAGYHKWEKSGRNINRRRMTKSNITSGVACLQMLFKNYAGLYMRDLKVSSVRLYASAHFTASEVCPL